MPFSFDLSLQNEVVQQLAATLLIVVVAYLLKRLAQRLALRYIEAPERQYRTSKLIGRVAAVLAFLIIVGVWSPKTSALLTILTVIGAGLAIATREVLLSFIGWTHLAIRHHYTQGDRIEVNGVAGDVVDIRLLHTVLMEIRGWVDADQSTGRIVHIPNSWVFQYPIYNFNRGFNFIWNELPITVTFRSDWQAAQDLMLEMAQVSASIVEQQAAAEIRRMSRDFLVHYSILTPFVYVRITDRGVRLTLRYLCETRKRRGTEHALTISILDAFKQHGGIELAYPMVGVAPMEPPQFGPLPAADRPAEDEDAHPDRAGPER